MSRPGLHFSTDVDQADWLKPRLRLFASAVAAVVPDGFAAYIRVPHREPGFEGNLPANQLRILCATLSQHTATPSACFSACGMATGGCKAVRLSRASRSRAAGSRVSVAWICQTWVVDAASLRGRPRVG